MREEGGEGIWKVDQSFLGWRGSDWKVIEGGREEGQSGLGNRLVLAVILRIGHKSVPWTLTAWS